MIDLAQRLAELASLTREPDTAVRLMALVNEALAAAGLPPKPSDGGPVTALRRAL